MEKTKILVLELAGCLVIPCLNIYQARITLVFGTFRDCNEDFFMHYEKIFNK